MHTGVTGGFGPSEGNFAFDELSAEGQLLYDPILWEKFLNNFRAEIIAALGQRETKRSSVVANRDVSHVRIDAIAVSNRDVPLEVFEASSYVKPVRSDA